VGFVFVTLQAGVASTGTAIMMRVGRSEAAEVVVSVVNAVGCRSLR
jgi:hypothetical protein